MKKRLFVLAFAFIGQQAFSQVYMLVVGSYGALNPWGTITCPSGERPILTIDPNGVETVTCIPLEFSDGGLSSLNIEINNILSLGYKIIEISKSRYNPSVNQDGMELVATHYSSGYQYVPNNTTFLFAMP